MLWIGTAVSVVAGILVLRLLFFTKHPGVVDRLGPVSDRWIAEHRVERDPFALEHLHPERHRAEHAVQLRAHEVGKSEAAFRGSD